MSVIRTAMSRLLLGLDRVDADVHLSTVHARCRQPALSETMRRPVPGTHQIAVIRRATMSRARSRSYWLSDLP